VARALATHPSLAAGTARVAASAGLVKQSGLRPNPRLVLQSENWRTYGGFQPNDDVDHYGYLVQPFETAAKRQRRVELARAGARRTELEKELLAKQIAARVKQAYWAAEGAARIHELWIENARNFRQIVVYHEARVREGAMAEADLLKVRLEEQRLAVAANSAGLDAERARIQLFREMGQTEFPAVAFTETLDAGGPPAPADVEAALRDRSEVKLARQAVDS
jgi:cobalt-zinc-cadmium efflux system outer membrane protein